MGYDYRMASEDPTGRLQRYCEVVNKHNPTRKAAPSGGSAEARWESGEASVSVNLDVRFTAGGGSEVRIKIHCSASYLTPSDAGKFHSMYGKALDAVHDLVKL